METQVTLFKGELMEELIRNYFLSLGYYVVRGAKFQYENIDLTDVDLFLYNRSSSLTRERINVDIKNKKAPQALERILWANGLMKVLNFDSCIVATIDRRPIIQKFGQQHNTKILDGTFLSKLKANAFPNRLSEEELCKRLATVRSYKTFPNRDWRFIYEASKSKLLTEQDFSGFNSVLSEAQYFIEKAISDIQKREVATRMIYLTLSHLLIIIDFLNKDIAFLEPTEREKKLGDGFRFGNLGRDGLDKIISLAAQISNNSKSPNSILQSLDSIPVDILKSFFSKNDTSNNVFFWAKELEQHGYNNEFVNPQLLSPQLKALISVVLDYSNIERRKFFECYSNNNI